MSLLIAHELTVAFGDRALIDAESFAIGPRDRVGLVGPNGSGKSTLLRILAGARDPDSGEIQWMRGTRVGFLTQDLPEPPPGSLVDTVLAQAPGRRSLEIQVETLQSDLSAATQEEDQLDLAGRLLSVQEQLAEADARFGRHRAERILTGLGFDRGRFDRPVAELSGGWRMRAALAGLLLADPDLLLLDEPTNHLDVASVAWLDAFLRSNRRSLIVVSHDRHFLDRQIDRVLSFEPEGLRSWSGNYSDYRRQRAAELEQMGSRAERLARKRAELESFIARFKAKASKARQAQSRVKMLERLDSTLTDLPESRQTVRFRFPSADRPGREVLLASGLVKKYGTTTVYAGASVRVERGQRVAIVGSNGAGKTTLLRMLAGELPSDAGEVTTGHNVRLGYYAQHLAEHLPRKSTVLEHVASLVPTQPTSWVRGVLGSFLFQGDDVDKPIGALSGGERARVALASLLVRPANVLLMDEPTNHLDIESCEALLEALADYDGTLVFVSHDRSFIDKLANRIWEVRDGQVLEHPGNLDDYLYHLQITQEDAASGDTSSAPPSVPAPADKLSDKDRRRTEAQARQARSVRERPLRDRLKKVETDIATHEERARMARAALADPGLYDDFARARVQTEALRGAEETLESLYAEWEQLEGELAALQ